MTKLDSVLAAVLALGLVTACDGTIDAPAPGPEQDGLNLTHADADFIAGTYVVAERAIEFESTVVDGDKTVRLLAADGAELVRIEMGDTKESLRMWHYGAPQEVAEQAEPSPEARQWIESEEIQLVASMWRDFSGTQVAELPAAEALVQYGIHVDEVLGKMVDEAAHSADNPDDLEHRCSDCPGRCGPGCWSWGSNWYCENHDCCCDHYGSWACYSWCYAYPKCPDKSHC